MDAGGARGLHVVPVQVDDDVVDGQVGVHESILHDVTDDMAIADGHVAVDGDVEIHQQADAAFADAAFFHVADAVDAFGDLADLLLDVGGGGGIHHFVECGAQEAEGVHHDDGAGGHGGPVIHGLVAGAADEGEGDADEGGGGGEGIGAVVPGVVLEGGAIEGLAGADDFAVEGASLMMMVPSRTSNVEGGGGVMRHERSSRMLWVMMRAAEPKRKSAARTPARGFRPCRGP